MEYKLNTLCNITINKTDNQCVVYTARYIVGSDGMYLYYTGQPKADGCGYWKRRVLVSSISNVSYINNQ